MNKFMTMTMLTPLYKEPLLYKSIIENILYIFIFYRNILFLTITFEFHTNWFTPLQKDGTILNYKNEHYIYTHMWFKSI